MKTRDSKNVVLLTLLISALAGGALLIPDSKGQSPRDRRDPLEWGLYQILWSRKYSDQLNTELSRYASKPDYVMFFRDLGRPFPTFAIDSMAAHGATTIVSLELWQWHGTQSGSYIARLNDGAFDDFLRTWAEAAAKDGRRVLLRFGFEFNGNWFTWSGDPVGYVKAWRRAHDLFKDAGADNVEWVWAPNVVSCPDTKANDMHLYYPGDDYVDWIGVDGYNFGDHHDKWHVWQSFDEVFGTVLDDYAKRYKNKPVMITEFGCAPGKTGQREAWIRGARAALDNRPQVRAAVWFNYDKRREREPNWRIDVTPESLRAFNETFAAPIWPAEQRPRQSRAP